MAAILPIGWGWNPPLVGGWRSIWAPPRYRLRRTTAPRQQPLTLDEVVLHLRLAPDAVSGPEKPLLEATILAATQALEDHAGVSVMEQEYRMTMMHWPYVWGDAIEIPMPPFRELRGVSVRGDAVPTDQFAIELDDRLSAKMYPLAGYWQPAVIAPPLHEAIRIDFLAGAEKPEEISPAIRQALLMAIAHWYENRESSQQFQLYPVIELGWRSLLEPYRMPGFA